jgi:hypothetical protein
MTANRVVTTAFVLGALLSHALIAGAQVTPGDMRSGVSDGTGNGTVPVYAVPPGFDFVLTDVVWSLKSNPSNNNRPNVLIKGSFPPGVTRWAFHGLFDVLGGTGYSLQPMGVHLTTGIAFQPMEQVSIEVGNVQPGVVWTVAWTGYVSTPPTTALQGSDAPAVANQLSQNAPNPFNPETKIRYAVSTPGKVELRIYDSNGRVVRGLVEASQGAGEYLVTWDGRSDSGSVVPSGVYFYELVTPQGREAKRAVVVK